MYTADDPKIGTGRRQMITVRNLAGRIARTLFVTVPDEATQFFWLSLEPSFEFDDDPRWLRFVPELRGSSHGLQVSPLSC